MAASTETRTRICPFCEATCGLELEVDRARREVVRVRGNPRDVLSAGYLCPKGVALRELDADPDRLRRPLLRRGGRGGHFAAFEQPELFVEEVRACFRKVR